MEKGPMENNNADHLSVPNRRNYIAALTKCTRTLSDANFNPPALMSNQDARAYKINMSLKHYFTVFYHWS